MNRVQISSAGASHSVVVDGVDLSRGIRGAELSLEPGHLPTLTLDPIIVELDTYAGETRVVVTDHAKEALIALGWTPPPLADVARD